MQRVSTQAQLCLGGYTRERQESTTVTMIRQLAGVSVGCADHTARLNLNTVTTRHPEEVEAAIAYLARRGQTDPGAIHWSYSALDLGPGPDGAPRVNLRLIGVAGDERVSVHLPPDAWPTEAALDEAG